MKQSFNSNITKHISEIIKKYELDESVEYSELNKENTSFKVFICGKSGSGKTTFLNALLGLTRDELFTSASISTMTRFNFLFGDTFKYHILGEPESNELPGDSKQRQEEFRRLNSLEQTINIYLPNDILRNIEIIDIPGFFDNRNKNLFMENVFYEADLIVFLKKFSDRLSPKEKEFVEELKNIGIKFIILFTFMDFYNPAEGIPEDELPVYLNNKAKEYSDEAIFFPI